MDFDALPYVSMCASYEEYAAARAQGWLARSERGLEVLTHKGCWDLLSDKRFDIAGGFRLFLDPMGITEGRYREEWDKQIVCQEGEARAHLRVPFARLLKPGNVVKLQDTVRELIHGILDDIEDGQQVDFMSEIAWRLPTQLYCRLISAPLELAAEFGRITQSINPPLLTFDRSRVQESEDAYFEGLGFIRDHVNAKRKDLGNDFTSELIRCELEGLITADEVISVAMSLLMASMDNTVHQMGLVFGTLLEDPDRWAQAAAKPSAAAQVAEEAYRYCPRFTSMFRHATDPMEWNGVQLPAGTRMFAAVKAGNRDEATFHDPDKFIVGRPAARQLIFGSHHYSCLGATLARLEITEMIKIIVERFPSIRLVQQWAFNEGPSVTEVEHLQVSLRP